MTADRPPLWTFCVAMSVIPALMAWGTVEAIRLGPRYRPRHARRRS